MDNQDNSWSWGDMEPAQPQETTQNPPQNNEEENNAWSWGDMEPAQPQETNQSKEDDTWNWDGSNVDNENPFSDTSSPSQQPQTVPVVESETYSFLGSTNKLQVRTDLYHLNNNFIEGVKELDNTNQQPTEESGKFNFEPQENTELANILKNITKIAISKGQKIKDCFVYKLNGNEESLPFKLDSTYSFIYTLQSCSNSNSVILDLSSIKGPKLKSSDTIPNILEIIPGWIPFTLGKNIQNESLIAIMGTFEPA